MECKTVKQKYKPLAYAKFVQRELEKLDNRELIDLRKFLNNCAIKWQDTPLTERTNLQAKPHVSKKEKVAMPKNNRILLFYNYIKNKILAEQPNLSQKELMTEVIKQWHKCTKKPYFIDKTKENKIQGPLIKPKRKYVKNELCVKGTDLSISTINRTKIGKTKGLNSSRSMLVIKRPEVPETLPGLSITNPEVSKLAREVSNPTPEVSNPSVKLKRQYVKSGLYSKRKASSLSKINRTKFGINKVLNSSPSILVIKKEAFPGVSDPSVKQKRRYVKSGMYSKRKALSLSTINRTKDLNSSHPMSVIKRPEILKILPVVSNSTPEIIEEADECFDV